jgi:peptidoglycan/xylan/chitin deacetylase (PgdA/CDA1 family)
MPNLWSRNTPEFFWLSDPTFQEDSWNKAIRRSTALLDFDESIELSEIPFLTLGEGRFGLEHWRLSQVKRTYYLLKPVIPRTLIRVLRRLYTGSFDSKKDSYWPIDPRFPAFQWEVLRQLLTQAGNESMEFMRLWPENHRFAFVLTHDVETADGQNFVRKVADLEESLGFRSSFNFVLERYPLDINLMQELRQRGFEIGCHGLHHDGKLFDSRAGFQQKAEKINARLKEYGMKGFRAPLTHRNPEWMQALEIQYDLSFFDTDPYEPIPGGAMTIWPFFIGHFVELPYTLVQDYTLTSVLAEKSARIWLEKVDFIERYHGMALLNSHPDYLRVQKVWDVYNEFLVAMKQREGYWHALPCDAAQWWKDRLKQGSQPGGDQRGFWKARLINGAIEIDAVGG